MPVCTFVWSCVICNVSFCQISWHQIFIKKWKVSLYKRSISICSKGLHSASELDNPSLEVQLFIFTPCCVHCRQKWVKNVTSRAKISGAKMLLKAFCILVGQSYLIITSLPGGIVVKSMNNLFWPKSEHQSWIIMNILSA